MKLFVRLIVIALIVLSGAQAQEPMERDGEFTAAVLELKGVCYVRNSESGSAIKLKVDDRLCAGQELSGDKEGYLKILFRSSGSEKVIDRVLPKWYVIPNVPSKKSGRGDSSKLAGRAKGRGLQGNCGHGQTGEKNKRPS